MCLRLKYAEAVVWKNKAAELVSRAKNKSADQRPIWSRI